MQPTIQFHVTQSQTMVPTLTLTQQLSLKMLQLPIWAVEQQIQDAAQENAFLEIEEEHDPCRISRDQLDRDSRAHDACLNESPARGVSLYEHLLNQLALTDEPDEIKQQGEVIIAALTPEGRLTTPLEQLDAQAVNGERAKIEQALRLIQSLEPVGVAARDLQECLQLQVDDETPHAARVRALIARHLPEVAQGRIADIAAGLGCTVDQAEQAVAVLRGLEPLPGRSCGSSRERPIRADLRVEIDAAGGCDVQLVNPRISVHARGKQFLRRCQDQCGDRTDQRQWLQRQADEAVALVRMLADRRTTLLAVARAVVEHQREFLVHGPEHQRPLTTEMIGEKIGRAPSTVTRAIAGKWLETSRGNLPLRDLFDSPAAAGLSRRAVCARLRQLVERESDRAPLNDSQLAARLAAQGIVMPRRTVAKYRSSLGIPSASHRRLATAA